VSFGFDNLNQVGLFYYCLILNNKVLFRCTFWQLVLEKCCEVSYLIGGIKVLYFEILEIIKLHVASRKGCYTCNFVLDFVLEYLEYTSFNLLKLNIFEIFFKYFVW